MIRSLDWATYKNLPDYLEVRETRVRVEQPGFRTKEIIVVTTLLDPEATTKEDLASLYRSRWSQELDIRDIKITLQMDVLRCKSPELVRKEIWTHVLAYNLIRTIMAQAASQHEIQPREISFKGTIQTLAAFQPLMGFNDRNGATSCQELYLQLLQAVATHRVADRPDRFEPRKRKRKPRKAEMMTKPRWELKRLMRKGLRKFKRHSWIRPLQIARLAQLRGLVQPPARTTRSRAVEITAASWRACRRRRGVVTSLQRACQNGWLDGTTRVVRLRSRRLHGWKSCRMGMSDRRRP